MSFTPGDVHQRSPTARESPAGRVLDLMVKAVDNAPTGSSIHLTTAKLGDKPLYRALRAAIDRGRARAVPHPAQPPVAAGAEPDDVLGSKVWKKDWAVGCDDECRQIESRGNLPQTRLLVSSPA